jgi:hypothetical protein
MAIVFNISTMKGWRRFDFLVHHLPFALVVGAFLLLGFPVQLFHFTFPLTLLTSLNEAISAMQALGCLNWANFHNRLYLLLVIPCLIAAEVYEAVNILQDTTDYTIGLKLIALCVLTAPLYHVFVVLPVCWNAVNERWQTVGASYNDINNRSLKMHQNMFPDYYKDENSAKEKKQNKAGNNKKARRK